MKVLLLLCLCVTLCASYTLKNSYGPNDILGWNYYSGADPTHGYVYYASNSEAHSWNLVTVTNNQAIIRSDSTTVSTGSGRASVRLTSQQSWNQGLFIWDVSHMPYGSGTWPALWTVNGAVWPNGGEIDVVEGVNAIANNQITLHTNAGCTVPNWQNAESGVPQGGNCDVVATGNAGCSIMDYDSWSYGAQFNAHGGGVYVMQWAVDGIYVWFFTHGGGIPADITNGAPNPAGWGNPRGRFSFGQGCDGSHFYNHNIVIDNTFCGDWAGAVYPGGNGACQSFVQNNPSAFTEAYWAINSIKVYQ